MRVSEIDLEKFPPAIQEQIRIQLGSDVASNNLLAIASRFLEKEDSEPQARGSADPLDLGMNKTEAAYAGILEMRRIRREIIWYGFEALRFRLARQCTYTPDFIVQLPNGCLEIHEVKARTAAGKILIRDDAATKLRLVSEQYHMFPVYIAAGYRGQFELHRW